MAFTTKEKTKLNIRETKNVMVDAITSIREQWAFKPLKTYCVPKTTLVRSSKVEHQPLGDIITC